MKSIIATLLLAIVALSLAVQPLFAQVHTPEVRTVGQSVAAASHARLEMAKRNYALALRTDNNGLVESALYQVVKLRIAYPDEDVSALAGMIERLGTTGRTQKLRYTALLCSTVLASPSLVDARDIESIDAPNELFSLLAGRLSARLYVMDRK